MNHVNKSMLANVLQVTNIVGANLYNIKVANRFEDSQTKMYNRSTKTFVLPIIATNVHRDTI